jgi:ADP-ribose pyrophosphatase
MRKPPRIIDFDRLEDYETDFPKPPHPHLNLFQIHYELDSGKQGTYRFASRKQNPPLNGTVTSDAVVVVAIVKGNVVVTSEFRLPLNGFEYGFPAGLIDKGETVEQAAARELEEETGLKVKKLLQISPPITSSSGLTDEAVTMVIVEAEGEITDQGQESLETISVELMNLTEINRLCSRKGKYENAMISAKVWPLFAIVNNLSVFSMLNV